MKITKAEVKFLEMFVVEVFIMAMYLIGAFVAPDFGEFLGCTPVIVTIIVSYLVYIAFGFVDMYEFQKEEEFLQSKEDR